MDMLCIRMYVYDKWYFLTDDSCDALDHLVGSTLTHARAFRPQNLLTQGGRSSRPNAAAAAAAARRPCTSCADIFAISASTSTML